MAKKVIKKKVKPQPEFIITHTAGNTFKVGDKVIFEGLSKSTSLCGQAEDAISNLEARISKIIRRINSITN